MKRPPQDLAALRAARLPLLAERQALPAEDYGRDEARGDVATYCTAAAADAHGRLAYAVGIGNPGQAFVLRARPNGELDVGPLLAALLGPDKLAGALGQFADALPPSTDRAARAARLVEIAAELDAIEEAEEIEIMRLENLGLTPIRRGDANPAIVLKRRD